ncbi:hypothetical protein O181_064084 [Austropuccinia psidii MF-1]|uniref:Uncharacterized protein n=1 Tax=Austropuccinia psidii MF-1 TaxID=1389203 RepID=A0A9Q3END6_9BASI|nr:hypothetical protein [Austropuccinia psidii MF-1]
MDQQSTSKLPPLPEDSVEGQYEEESEEEYQTVQIQSLMKQMQYLLLTQKKKKGKRREKHLIHLELVQVNPHYQLMLSLKIHQYHLHLALEQHPHPKQKKDHIVSQTKYSNPHPTIQVHHKERFLKVEPAAEIEGASGEDIARKVIFMSGYEGVKEKIEEMQAYEENDWTKLKDELTTEWERVEPDRGYRPEYLKKLFNNTKRAGGTINLAEYKRFLGEYEKITNYLYKYGYIRREVEHNEELYASLSLDIRTSIIKEMRTYKVMIQARDGGYIVPEMKVLKSYIEQGL